MTNAAPIRKHLPLGLLLLAGCAAAGKGPEPALSPAPVPARVSMGYNAPELTEDKLRPAPPPATERRIDRNADIIVAPDTYSGSWPVSAPGAVPSVQESGAPAVPSPPVGLAVKAAHDGMAPLPDLDAIIVTDSRSAAEREAARRRDEDEALAAAEIKLAALAAAPAPSATATPAPAPVSYSPTPPVAAERPAPEAGAEGYAIHLASYKEPRNAVRGWDVLRAEHELLLTGLTPRATDVFIEGKGAFTRLIAGPFELGIDAEAACAVLREGGRYCAVLPFEGKPL
jgi:hypothetical protein